MSRKYNFSAGPAALPEAVLQRARDEMLDWQGVGASVMEVSHRGKAFEALAAKADDDLRGLLAIPDDYAVLFLQGGATQHFAQVPMNIAQGRSADYVLTGHWGEKAAKEAGKVCAVRIAASSADSGFRDIPPRAGWQLDPDAAYVHLTPNETIHGVEFHDVPDTGAVPIVADMSSTLLSRPIDVARYGLIYACAQKNIGPAGLTIVIVREDLLGQARPGTPTMLDYKSHADADSMLNTPPTFALYLAGLIFDWLKEQGGLDAMARTNRDKAAALYAAIDASNGYYRNEVAATARSWMNVPFQLHDAALDAAFLREAEDAGLAALKGHRVVGGMRASLYHAVPMAGVEALVSFMADFARRHG